MSEKLRDGFVSYVNFDGKTSNMLTEPNDCPLPVISPRFTFTAKQPDKVTDMKPYEKLAARFKGISQAGLQMTEAQLETNKKIEDSIIKANQDILRRWRDVNDAPLRPHVVLAEEKVSEPGEANLDIGGINRPYIKVEPGNFTTLSKNNWIGFDPANGKDKTVEMLFVMDEQEMTPEENERLLKVFEDYNNGLRRYYNTNPVEIIEKMTIGVETPNLVYDPASPNLCKTIGDDVVEPIIVEGSK